MLSYLSFFNFLVLDFRNSATFESDVLLILDWGYNLNLVILSTLSLS